jgi:hypothetical protein
MWGQVFTSHRNQFSRTSFATLHGKVANGDLTP